MAVILFFFLTYNEAFKFKIDSLLSKGQYPEALKIVEDSFRESPDKLEFEKWRVYVLAYEGEVFKASNAYLRLYEVTGKHDPELLHQIALGIFNTDNEKLARFLAFRLALIHDVEAEIPIARFIKRLDNEKRPFFIENLHKIADSNVFSIVLDLAKEAKTYDEVFSISPLLSRLAITQGPDVLDTLLQSDSPYTKAIALWALGDMMSPPKDVFDKFSQSNNTLLAMLAKIGALKHVSKPDLSILREYLSNPEPGIRKILAFHLGYFGMDAEPLLVKLLNDPKDDVKREAARSLYYMGSERALTPYIQAISYIDPKKKIWGIDNIAQIADSSAASYIARGMSGTPYPLVTIHGIWALATLGGSVARSILPSFLTSNNKIIRDEAALALGYMGDTRGLIQITRLARSPNVLTRKRSLWILAKLADKRGYKYLFDGLKDESLDVRVVSALGLWRILNNADTVKKE